MVPTFFRKVNNIKLKIFLYFTYGKKHNNTLNSFYSLAAIIYYHAEWPHYIKIEFIILSNSTNIYQILKYLVHLWTKSKSFKV